MSRYNMKIEVKDSVVKATVYDKYGEYVSEVTCDDSSSESVIKATKKAINHAIKYMKAGWPKHRDLYYAPCFTDDDLFRARNWIGCTFDRKLKKNNLVFRTKDEAVAAAKKMLRAIPQQEEDKNE